MTPIAGLALSGGGARAALSGYGAWQAFDNRWPPAAQAGIGGVTQSLTYLAGLSGGEEPTGAIAMSNFSTVQQLLALGSPTGSNISASAATDSNSTVQEQVYQLYLQQISGKAKAGFNVTISDILGFILGSLVLYDNSIPGVDVSTTARTWSDIQTYSGFAEGRYPMPIIMVDEVVPPGIPNVTLFDGVLIPAYNSSNNTIVIYYCVFC
jgi:lysophospholipase